MVDSQISLDCISVLQEAVFASATFDSTWVLDHGGVAQGPIVMVRKGASGVSWPYS